MARLARDPLATLASEHPCVEIAKERVFAFRLPRTLDRHSQGAVGDVAQDGIGVHELFATLRVRASAMCTVGAMPHCL